MRGWLTPNDIPVNTVCRVLRIPDSLDWIAPVTGAILALQDTFNWEQFGTLTPEEVTERYSQMVNEFLDAGFSNCMIGVVFPYVTNDPPNGALPCDGSSFLRVDYPQLYGELADEFIVDADTFVTPDLRSRVIVGVGEGAGLSDYTVNQQGGEETHALTETENATHTHTDTGHVHSYQPPGASGLALAPGELPIALPNIIPGLTGSASANITASGDGTPHNNIQPYTALKYGLWWR